jgi:hypothetical protein
MNYGVHLWQTILTLSYVMSAKKLMIPTKGHVRNAKGLLIKDVKYVVKS